MPPRPLPKLTPIKLKPPPFRHYSTHLPPSPLHGKKILITGASRGIGRAIASRFAKEGGACILVGRNGDALEEVRGSLVGGKGKGEGEGDGKGKGGNGEVEGDGGKHEVVVGDVSSESFWRGEFRGRKDITHLINAAGITHSSPLFTTQVSSLESVIATNLMGTMLACRIVGLGMLKNKQGCIINIASLLGLKGGRGSTAYAASKAGVIGFTRALAAEAGEKGIRVNVIVPGYIETDMTDAMHPSARTAALNAIPLKRFGDPSEIADAALFLATNAYANNCVLNLDGGLSAM